MKASIVGLGIIGAECAKHLDKDGVLAACWNRSPKSDVPKFTQDLKSIPAVSDIIHIIVANPQAVSEVIEAILPGLNSKHTIIQSSTIDPDSSEGFYKAVTKTGAKYLETPFTGSLPAAQKRELVYYL